MVYGKAVFFWNGFSTQLKLTQRQADHGRLESREKGEGRREGKKDAVKTQFFFLSSLDTILNNNRADDEIVKKGAKNQPTKQQNQEGGGSSSGRDGRLTTLSICVVLSLNYFFYALMELGSGIRSTSSRSTKEIRAKVKDTPQVRT